MVQLVKGDPGMEDIYKWTQNQINTPFRGRTGMPSVSPTFSCQFALLLHVGLARHAPPIVSAFRLG